MPLGSNYKNPRGGTAKGSGTQSPAAGARKLTDVKNQGTTSKRVGGRKGVNKVQDKATRLARTGK